MSTAEQILNSACKKQDYVYAKISTCEHSTDLFAIKVKYHKHCYRDYLRLRRNLTIPAGRPVNIIQHELHK